MNTKIRFFDPGPQHEGLIEDAKTMFATALASGNFVGGKLVKQFEEAFAQACGCKRAIAVNSGTDALTLALRALGVGEHKGDKVVTTPFTFAATVEAIINVGAEPVFCDIDASMNLDPVRLKDILASESSIKAVIFVHLYGRMNNVMEVKELTDKYQIPLVEDCAQAFGAAYNHDEKIMPAGSIGTVGCFSFYPTKTLGGIGDGGAITVNDTDAARIFEALRNHGSLERYIHLFPGYNSRLDAIQAGFLSLKLDRYATIAAKRGEQCRLYEQKINNPDVWMLPIDVKYIDSYGLFTIGCKNRDKLVDYLSSLGIETATFYTIPCHQQEAFKKYCDYRLPYAETAAKQVVSLPVWPGLPREDQEFIISSINSFQS